MSSTAASIREMAAQYRVSYIPTQSDLLASHITRLSSDNVRLDEIEFMLIALQRAGHISRDQLVHLQACICVKPTVTFDPFRDFETLGYLRNVEKEKDLAIVKLGDRQTVRTRVVPDGNR